ncbi:ABC transporter permease [Saccharothrix xinjiangensis]|uniref:ABC transporter permease n=1 Tax=Saccharothrix xinjiangensis TaxID=204798 RepID=A0ABV9XR31_9PSEU
MLGLLTFGVQATAHPDGVPLAVAVGVDAPPQLRGIADQLAATGSEEVSWRVTTPDRTRDLLSRQEVYGVLELVPGGATVVLSGAVNPSGTQVAQQVLGGVAQGAGLPARVVVLDPASAAGRTAPLAASALLWIGGLVAGAAFTRLVRRPDVTSRLVGVVAATALGVGVVAGLFTLWDPSLPLGWRVLGYLALVGTAFALVQGALLRLFGLRAMAVLGPLYLVAPSVAGQAPELLDPAYRALLWSWTPFRFSTEGLRALLHGGEPAAAGLWVPAALAAVGLVALLWPSRRSAGERSAGERLTGERSANEQPSGRRAGERSAGGGAGRLAGEEAQPDLPDRVVDVGVDEADRLPGAQREHTA